MAGTVTHDMIEIDDCDASLASWTINGGIGSQNIEDMIEEYPFEQFVVMNPNLVIEDASN